MYPPFPDRILGNLELESALADGSLAAHCDEGRHGFQVSVAGIPVTVEPYLSSAELFAFAKKKYPYHDFQQKSLISWDVLRKARFACEASLACFDSLEDAPGGPRNTTDFGTVIAARLESFCYISDTDYIEYFETESYRYGCWRGSGKEKALKKIVRRALMDEFRPLKAVYEQGGKMKLERYGPVPPVCKRQGFRNAVAEDVGLVLLRSPPKSLDADDTRRFLQDHDGRIYDFVRDCFVDGSASLRLGRRLPFRFNEWNVDPVFKQKLSLLLDRIFVYFKAGAGPSGKTLEDGDPFGKTLAAEFKSLVGAEGSPSQYWPLILKIYKNNADEALWESLHLGADACALARRCEYSYKYGEGGIGKDVLHTIKNSFFGNRA
jgi:hypothetical protein